ncbi:MAG: diguanylate cyclase, partial [Pseudomonadota bacterium]|nr:diguanylate cyclase [Pseudomonadota bacterium]
IDSGDFDTADAAKRKLESNEMQSYEIECRFKHKNGSRIWVHAAVSLVRAENGAPLHFIAQIENLETRRRAEENLLEERQRLRVTLGAIADAVITTDADTRITYVNAAAEKLLGQELIDLVQRRFDEVVSLSELDASKRAANLLGKTMVHGSAFRRENPCVLHRSDGTWCYITDVVSPVVDAHGQITSVVIVLHDASADFARNRDLSHRASHDVTTGLVNRFEFQLRLKDTFERANHTDSPAAVLAIDLDHFKAVNDTGGHAAGDAMLRRVAEVLRTSVRQSDVVARVGGDEFAIILANCPPARSLLVAEQLLGVLNPLRAEWQGLTYQIGASIGLAVLEPGHLSENDWIEAADRACYQAKRAGRNRLHAVSVGDGGLPPARREQIG